MEQTPGQAIELSPEDNARKRRLYEEIAGRYAEMALIMGRTLGNNSLQAAVLAPGGKITLVNQEEATTERSSLCIEVDGGAWVDPPGVCRPGGCF
jgi:hypothetical protein